MAYLETMTGVSSEISDKTQEERRTIIGRSMMIALIAFLTLIDLFGSQAMLPSLVEKFQVSPAAMGFAVNASTIGMAAASLLAAIFSRRIDRKRGIWLCLALLSLPTFALSVTDDLTTFMLLRIAQGVFMATAFMLTLTHLSEICSVTAIGGAMAAYITGNVASNLFGRLLASGLADNLGITESFIGFAILNLLGAVAAYAYFGGRGETHRSEDEGSVVAAWLDHAKNPRLWSMLAIGFALLFVFVATFTYANFVLTSDVFALTQRETGLVYLIFAPAILTTPAATIAVARYGQRNTFRASMVVAMTGLALLLTQWLPLFLLGLSLVGMGLFFAQSVATVAVGQTVSHDRAAANGLYLASYYFGGVIGTFVIGQVFERYDWLMAVVVLLGISAITLLLARLSMVASTAR